MNTIPILWRPFDEVYNKDPYEMYAHLREKDPVHLSQTGEYIITRYEHIRSILKSPAVVTGNKLEWFKRGITYFESKDHDFTAIYEALNSFILMLNAEQHARVRTCVAKAWDNRQVDEVIKQNVNALLEQFVDTEIDVIEHFAQRLPVLTISAILGIPTDDYLHLRDIGLTMTKTFDLYVTLKDFEKINEASKEFINFFRKHIKHKTANPDAGLISKLILKNKNDNIGLSESELISICIFLFIAGEETTGSLIGTGIYTLLKHPDQLKMLRENTTLIESAIDEILRFDAVVQVVGRIANEDIAIADKVIPKGATLTLVLGAANRDERIFDNANTFNILRKPNRHIAFGTGPHFCLGDWLAKRQGQIAIQLLLEKFPNIHLPEQNITYYNNLSIRALTGLRVKLN